MNTDRKWKLDIYYAEKKEITYKKITEEQFIEKVGKGISSQILREVNNRMEHKTIPEVKEFFENGGKEFVLESNTTRGNVSIQAVEII
jgi:hypothetical protein